MQILFEINLPAIQYFSNNHRYFRDESEYVVDEQFYLKLTTIEQQAPLLPPPYEGPGQVPAEAIAASLKNNALEYYKTKREAQISTETFLNTAITYEGGIYC